MLHDTSIKSPAQFFILLILLFSASCKNDTSKNVKEAIQEKTIILKYAKGFSITDYGTYKVLEIKNPWPKSEKTYKYVLASQNSISKNQFNNNDFEAIIGCWIMACGDHNAVAAFASMMHGKIQCWCSDFAEVDNIAAAGH